SDLDAADPVDLSTREGQGVWQERADEAPGAAEGSGAGVRVPGVRRCELRDGCPVPGDWRYPDAVVRHVTFIVASRRGPCLRRCRWRGPAGRRGVVGPRPGQ